MRDGPAMVVGNHGKVATAEAQQANLKDFLSEEVELV